MSNSEVIAVTRRNTQSGPEQFILTVHLAEFDEDDIVLVDCTMTQTSREADGYVLARGTDLISLNDKERVKVVDDAFEFDITATANANNSFAAEAVMIDTKVTYTYAWITSGLTPGDQTAP